MPDGLGHVSITKKSDMQLNFYIYNYRWFTDTTLRASVNRRIYTFIAEFFLDEPHNRW